MGYFLDLFKKDKKEDIVEFKFSLIGESFDSPLETKIIHEERYNKSVAYHGRFEINDKKFKFVIEKNYSNSEIPGMLLNFYQMLGGGTEFQLQQT